MIVRTKQIACLEDLDKVLKASGLRIDECQIVPVVGKFKTNFYVYYDDGKPDPKAAKTEAAPAQDDTIDLSKDVEVSFEAFGKHVPGFCHEFNYTAKSKGATSTFTNKCRLDVSVGTNAATAEQNDETAVAVLQLEGVKGIKLSGFVTEKQLDDPRERRNIAYINVTGRDNIEKFADALETAAYRLRAMMAKEG